MIASLSAKPNVTAATLAAVQKVQSNATLAAKVSQSRLVTRTQSAFAGSDAGVRLVKSYKAGNRTIPDLKNATTRAGLADYTPGRLQFESKLKQGMRVGEGCGGGSA